MIRCVALAAAVAAILAAPATAQATGAEEVKIVVQSTAQLRVIDGSATTAMTDETVTTAGSTAPGGSTAGMGHLQLSLDYCIGGIEFDFPTVTGIRGNPSAFYGAAVGLSTGNTLGVQPFVRVPDSPTSGLLAFGNLGALGGRENDAPLYTGGALDLCDGTYNLFLGMVTRWDLTLPPQPMFAGPDTYRISIEATIM
jgi:hypothetical protein